MFSPYYAWSGRKDPDNHLCINIALYAPKGNRWAMTERSARAGHRDSHTFRVGPSDLEWNDGVLTLNFDEVSLPWPSNHLLPKRIKGRLTLKAGAITRDVFDIDSQGQHRWWPIAPSSRMEMRFDGGDIPDWSGHAYLDSNWGMEGLEYGFKRWDWARGELPDGDTVVLYDTWRKDGTEACLCQRISAADGSHSTFEMPPRTSFGRGFWGVERVSHADDGHVPVIKTVLEDGPFYTRLVVGTHLLGEPVTLMHESLSGDRFANPLVKAMLMFRMPRRRR